MRHVFMKPVLVLLLSTSLCSCDGAQGDSQAMEQLKQENEALKQAQLEGSQNTLKTFVITGKFTSIEMGDCLHLIFTDSAGKTWDFGSGVHHLPFKMSEIYQEQDEFKLKEEAKNQTYRLTLTELYGMICNGSDYENWTIEKTTTIIDAVKVDSAT